MNFREALSEIVPIDLDPAEYTIAGNLPELVARPSNMEELSRVIGLASKLGKAISPVGGCTQIQLGNDLEKLDLVLDMSGLMDITHNPGDLTATVQAGVTFAILQEELGKRGQFLAFDPPLPGRATIGGILATGLTGPMKWHYGSIRDAVIGMTVANADGRLTKSGGNVVKNVSGYDMARLHIGGMGTLGVIAEASFKLSPRPVADLTLVATFNEPEDVFRASLRVFGSSAMPLAITTFDNRVLELIRLEYSASGHYVAIRLGGRSLTLDRLIKECSRLCEEFSPLKVETLDPVRASKLWRGLADFGYDPETEPVASGRAFVKPSNVGTLVKLLNEGDESSGVSASVISNPAHGTVLVRWYTKNNNPDPTEVAHRVHLARQKTHSVDGRLIIERCSPDIRDEMDVWDEIGDAMTVMHKLKKQYDPCKILNPGRFVGGI